MSDAPNLITPEGLESMRAELEALEGEGRREIAERIKTAREWGDLKENSEYHDAKNEQAHLETKIARLREKISTAVVVEEGRRPRTGRSASARPWSSAISTGSSAPGRSSARTTRPPRRAASQPSRPSPARSSAGAPAMR